MWDKCKENYYKKGIRIFWLDEAEPEYGTYEFDNYRYYAGPALQCTNIYPVMYAKGFYDGLKAEGEKEIMSLVRCAWAGSQKYGVLTCSLSYQGERSPCILNTGQNAPQANQRTNSS